MIRVLLAVLGGVIALSSMESPLTSNSGSLPTSAASPVTALPPEHQLSRNPQLPQHPLGAYTDAQYEAAVAALRSNIAKQYQDVLQKLGYQDDNGNFIQGSVETEANRQKGLLQRSMDLADEDTTHQHQQNGTLFSGLRGTDQARAEFPFTDQLGQIETQTPLTLAQLYEQASGLMSDYTLQDNQLLADAATRAAGRIQSQPTDTGAGGAAPPPPTGSATYAGITIPSQDDAFSPSVGLAAANPGGGTTFGAAPGTDWSAVNALSGGGGSSGSAAPAPAMDMMMAPNATPALPVAQPAPAINSPGILSATQKKLLQYGGF